MEQETNRITFSELINRCLHDAGFFHQLQEDPAKALEQAGFAPTPSIVEALRHIDYAAIRRLHSACDPLNLPMC